MCGDHCFGGQSEHLRTGYAHWRKGRSAAAPGRRSLTTASVRGCFTKPSAKTWAALAVTGAEGPCSAEAEPSAQPASHDLRLFDPALRKVSVSPPGVCETASCDCERVLVTPGGADDTSDGDARFARVVTSAGS